MKSSWRPSPSDKPPTHNSHVYTEHARLEEGEGLGVQGYTEMAVESDDSVSEIIRAAASSLGYTEIRLLQETAVRALPTSHLFSVAGIPA